MTMPVLSRRGFVRAIAGMTAGAAIPNLLADAAGTRKPNILLLLTDDQGWGDVHSNDNPRIDTPNMDRLAAEGARFNRFYVSPVCAPTRASMLTGRYHPRTGVSGTSEGLEIMNADEVTIAEILKQNGYATGCFGKWHNGAHYPCHPNGQGFDEFFGFCMGHWNNYFDTQLEHNGNPVKTKGYINDVLTDAALAFIDTHQDEPFFCYVPYNTPHSPFQVPDKYFDKYKAEGLDDELACVYGMCENLDDNFGRLLDKLDALDLGDNTIVLFFGDNGPNTDRFNGNMRGRKGSVHEGGVRNVFFVRWPERIMPGTEIDRICAHIDLLPTLMEWTGAKSPTDSPPIDGISLAPLLAGKTADWPDRMIFHNFVGRGAVRTEQYRWVTEKGGDQLYDMIADPGEEHNIAEDRPEIAHKLKTAYDAWWAEVSQGQTSPPPIPVGYPGWPEVELPTPEATWVGGLEYGGRFPNNNWVTNWRSTGDYLYWELDVVDAGDYEVTLLYTCAEANLGAHMAVKAGGSRVTGIITEAHDPPFLPSPDRVPRIEVYEKKWADLTPGTISLPKGRTQLVVKALKIPGDTAMDLKAVRLKRFTK